MQRKSPAWRRGKMKRGRYKENRDKKRETEIDRKTDGRDRRKKINLCLLNIYIFYFLHILSYMSMFIKLYAFSLCHQGSKVMSSG